MKNFKDFVEALEKDSDDPCWKGYVQLGTKKKNGKEVPNCVPKEEVDLDEAIKPYISGTDKWEVLNSKGKTVKSFPKTPAGMKAAQAYLDKNFMKLKEEVAANSVAGGGVDMNPTGYSKRDKRKREDTDAMYRRNLGLGAIKKIMKERSAK